MADTFQETIGYLTAISAMFALFVGVICFAFMLYIFLKKIKEVEKKITEKKMKNS